MPRLAALVLLLLCAALGPSAEAYPRKGGGFGPGKPIFPKRGRTDAMLYAKAMRIQARMWWHLSPEGLLVDYHPQKADDEMLSHYALTLSDAAMWTGCYAASQACRWHVTRDPDALEQVRHLSKGLAMLSDVTGVPGRFGRNAGRILKDKSRIVPGSLPLEKIIGSPAIEGMAFRPDVSRDQLAGLTLGWACILRFVDDAEVQALAKEQIRWIARRLWDDGMWLRDYAGRKTKFGDLRRDVKIIGVGNGQNAAIGLAPFAVATAVHDDQHVLAEYLELCRSRYREALDDQHTWLRPAMTASNVNMRHVALLSTRLWAKDPKAQHHARKGLEALHKATRGWWNAGYCACQLLGGVAGGRRPGIIAELRAVLHIMSEREIPKLQIREYTVRRIATIREREGHQSWAWKARLNLVREPLPNSPDHPTLTLTRADWLFAYWLARASGEIKPQTGPGAGPQPQVCPVDLPPWREARAKAK